MIQIILYCILKVEKELNWFTYIYIYIFINMNKTKLIYINKNNLTFLSYK